jgi:hypothetical protein
MKMKRDYKEYPQQKNTITAQPRLYFGTVFQFIIFL